jgi:hypothetical protein
MESYSHSPGVQVVPYWVIDSERSEVQLLYPHVHLWPSYPLYKTSFQTRKGTIVENLSHKLVQAQGK